ncbi:hypothetical protein STSP2_03443 [Anaerohalosphaera lusitana]|uniref:Uncharacterized protein n=1 Tax=Anaerohalosphaera lusitana TaxID=1936003 RepID=A0A1U9NR23_9BACT|nr:DUF190 domain-containing protein [Anaerohalosphaera lusitana]AQT70237.1 hypothetical protein STSP2_03443 [Anaerohalosphaera lusitana]
MRVEESEKVLMRIFVGEADSVGGKPLYHEIVKRLRKEKAAGATVTRGICGFGAKSHMHTARVLDLSHDLPIIIEVVDSKENIDRIAPLIDDMVGDGLITMEKVQAIRYAPKE